jgi:RNA polymerase sigma-70 factor (ECF subfamily)
MGLETMSPSKDLDQRSGERELLALMERYQHGDREAVDELVRQLSPPLLRFFVYSRVPPNDVEDMLQDCWIRIHRSRHTYQAGAPVVPWVFAIARHTRLDGYRKRRRRESKEVLVETLPEVARPAEPSAALDPEEFTQLLADLPESQREVILMLKVSGMSLEEVARATSSTLGAIKQKAHRAYTKLRQVLERQAQQKEGR